MIIKSLKDGITSVLYPRHCPVCDDIVVQGEDRVCPACRPKLAYCEEPVCMTCGRPIFDYRKEYCIECAGKSFNFLKGFSLFQYNDIMQKIISDYKFNGKREYTDFLAEELASRFGSELERLEVDLLVPVPIHKTRLKERGYNQAMLLADTLGKLTGIRVMELLIRSRQTLPQKQLSKVERKCNLRGAFAVDDKLFDSSYKTIIIIDDIYTTGNTINECAGVLKQKGVQRVYFISLSIGNK